MSRTYKDRPHKVNHPEETSKWNMYVVYENDDFVFYKSGPIRGGLTKKPRKQDTEYHWMTTPGWWVREFMNQPQRIAGHQWEREVVKKSLEDLEDELPPDVGRKPHIYYW